MQQNISKDFPVVAVLPDKTSVMGERDEEQNLVERSRAGDQEAFETLVKRYHRMIDSVAFRMTGSLSDAEDLTQEVFLQAWNGLAGYRSQSRFSSWLYRIAVNHCLNWRKADSRRVSFSRDWIVETELRTDAAPEAEFADALSGQVQEALLRLPPKQRAAIILTAYEGMNHAEAARALGCSETTVSWRLFAARRKLKRLLKSALEQEGGLR